MVPGTIKWVVPGTIKWVVPGTIKWVVPGTIKWVVPGTQIYVRHHEFYNNISMVFLYKLYSKFDHVSSSFQIK